MNVGNHKNITTYKDDIVKRRCFDVYFVRENE